VSPRPAPRVFLLSPASSAGLRMALLLSPRARFGLAAAVRSPAGAPLGEVFRFASALYFRGKLAYAERFGRPAAGVPGSLVIAPGAGLLSAATPVRAEDLQRFAEVPIAADEPRFTGPLLRDAALVAERLGRAGEVVLLGSIASAKYVAPLLAVFGGRLLFPLAFVGRGDMSRGGLLLRAVRGGEELAYGPVAGAVRRGVRPPRLPPLPRATGVFSTGRG
jgi:hypothetical protein